MLRRILNIFEDMCPLRGFGSVSSSTPRLCWAFVIFIIFVNSCHGFYFPSTYTQRQTYSVGDAIFAKVNSLRSTETQIPYSYYSLPYCEPQGGVKTSVMNLGQLVMGDQIQNSPYRFQMNVNETVFLCVKGPLNADEVKLLKQRNRDLYKAEMSLDNFPLTMFLPGYSMKNRMIGFPIGFSSFDDFIFNHLKFTIFIHEHEGIGIEIGGFEVVPCSVKKHSLDYLSKLDMYEHVPPISCPSGPWGLEYFQIIQENVSIAFTYEVEFVKSDPIWPYKWDSYFEKVHPEYLLLSIFDAAQVIFITAVLVFIIYWKTIRRDRYNDNSNDLPGWKLVVGDVFRQPRCPKLLCVLVGDGIQITAMALSAIIFASLSFMSVSPSSRGMLLTSMVILHLFFSILAGYTAVRLWRIIKGTADEWKSISLSVACFFPGIVFLILSFSNFFLSHTHSTIVVPMSLFFSLITLWFCIIVPLTLIGGFIGTKAETIYFPVPTNHIQRQIPARKYRLLMILLLTGIFPFVNLLNELSFIHSDIWQASFYSDFRYLLIVLLLLIVLCAVDSVTHTYLSLNAEDWRWWWTAFFTSALTGVFVFLYSIKFLVFDLQGLSGPISVTLYLGYSLIMATAVMLATGTIGFLASFYFVHYLYSSYKIS